MFEKLKSFIPVVSDDLEEKKQVKESKLLDKFRKFSATKLRSIQSRVTVVVKFRQFALILMLEERKDLSRLS